ncbi:TlpA disulfide reductase family protein [Flavobacterium sp. NRK F7]|uniref:TlpA family protein disulfide reductase n=1 Tax=Flavobacterium sp. NRK F7 TaxID=2954930 RepID=UPI00209174E9|nr:TlpA disulfide reductase family protein [Flavobacterium sp. NRK F7]MCO6161944.1 TlpA family protein disulfide reductase [Flavobacterium sp. NRK F7]
MKKLVILLLFAVLSIHAQDASKMVSFEGKIVNRNSDSIVLASGKNFKKTLRLNKRGQFKDAFEIPSDGLFQLFDGSETTMLFLKNGYDLKLTMDAKSFDESIKYEGKGAVENNYLAKKALSDEAFEKDLDVLFTEDETAFQAGLNKKKTDDLAALEQAGVDTSLSQMLTAMIQQESMMLNQFYTQKKMAEKMNGVDSPSFNFENHKGGMTKLEDFKGKYVYIDVWATWCAPCRAEIPYLKKIEEKYHNDNIVFVSISVDTQKDHEKWKKFVAEKELGGVQLFADNNWNSDFIKAYGINAIPRFILIGPDGKVVFADAPRPSSATLDSTLKEFFNK